MSDHRSDFRQGHLTFWASLLWQSPALRLSQSAVGGSGLRDRRHQRQKIAAALVAKEADFRLLAEQSGDMVMRIAIDRQILYASPSSARVLGWAPNALVNTSILAGINPADLARSSKRSRR
ncbi:PAS domain-containing protein [Bradyrhizobium japonicum]|uniref:PAS domain-containing protein n=1 Tax=Bradyrhizobium japonicum TaxID=375 RepID=UPI002012197C|nr:PAS domain-containing protein [Bradyrhizobium japonicum]